MLMIMGMVNLFITSKNKNIIWHIFLILADEQRMLSLTMDYIKINLIKMYVKYFIKINIINLFVFNKIFCNFVL